MAPFSLKVSAPTRELLFTGFDLYLTNEGRGSKGYASWRGKLTRSVLMESTELALLIMSQFPPTSEIDEVHALLEIARPAIELSANVLVCCSVNGVSDHMSRLAAYRVAKLALDGLTLVPEPFDLSFRKWLFAVYSDNHEGAYSALESLSWFIKEVRIATRKWSLPDAVFGPIVQLLVASGVGIYKMLDLVLETFSHALYTATGQFSERLFEYTSLGRAFLSVLLPEGRRRPKAVWALLFASDFARLTPAEKFALSLPEMQVDRRYPDYEEWASFMLGLVNSTGEGDVELFPKEAIRPHRLPRNPIVFDKEIAEQFPLIQGETKVLPVVTNAIKRMLRDGVPQGVDGAWFATPQRLTASVDRYDVERPVNNLEDLYLIRDVAHAMAEQAPHLYQDAEALTIGAIISNLKIKYSPGLPFIGHFKDRKELRDHGFIRAIHHTARKILESGVHPGSFAHAFDKVDIVGLQKLLDGKNIRTVIAQDLITSVVELVALGDLGKRLPRMEDWVINSQPRSEAGVRSFYDALKERKTVVQADAKEFDSKLGPLVFVEGLTELRAQGFIAHPAGKSLTSIARAHYISMAQAPMMLLATGEQFESTGGGMTGQVLTATDNRDGFRMTVISAWAKYFDKPPKEFWKFNTLGNAGDDNAWGSDHTLDEIKGILKLASEMHGLEIIIEQTRWEDLELIGLNVTEVPKSSIPYYLKYDIPVPTYAIRQKPESLILKRTEFKTTLSGKPPEAFVMGHLSTIIGSSMLTAHVPDLYHDFACAYMDEVEFLLLRYFEKVTWELERAEDGSVLSALVIPGNVRSRYKNPESIEKRWRAWLKGNRLPTYDKVFKTWVVPKTTPSAMGKRHARLMGFNPRIGSIERAMYGVIALREALYHYIPNHMAKALPEFIGADVSVVMRDSDFLIAKFVWLSLWHKTKQIPSKQLFTTVMKENPYASAADPVAFFEWLAIASESVGHEGSSGYGAKNLESLIAPKDCSSEELLEMYRAQMLVLTGIYAMIETLFKGLKKVPIIGLLVQLFALSTRDMNRVYAVLNYIHMIATGRSSMVISNMMPPDPFAWIKQLSVILTNMLPVSWSYRLLPGVKHYVGLVPSLVEVWAAWETVKAPNVARAIHRLLAIPEAWERLVDQELTIIHDNPGCSIAVAAPTATGKSTLHVGALWLKTNFQQIWVISPTVTSVLEYANPTIPVQDVETIFKGKTLELAKRVKVITYGAFINRLASGDVLENSIFIFDEYHLCQVDMLSAWFKIKMMLPKCPIICVSATPPAHTFPRCDHRIDYGGTRRFNVNVQRVTLSLGNVVQDLFRNNPAIFKRALIVCPTLAKAEMAKATLERLSIASSIVSRATPTVPTYGTIVATTIVDTAVTIDPVPTVLIDMGETIHVTLTDQCDFFPSYIATVVPTGPSAHTQRTGRVGRLTEGRAIVLGSGGLGRDPPPTLTAYALLRDPQVTPNLLSVYGLNLAVQAYDYPAGHVMAGLLSYFRVNNEQANRAVLTSTLANSLYIISRLSSGIAKDDIVNELLNLQYSSLLDEYALETATAVTSLEYGAPGCENPLVALDFIAGGGFYVNLNGKELAASCLVIRDCVVLPPNIESSYAIENLKEEKFPALQPLNVSRIVTRNEWAVALSQRTHLPITSGLFRGVVPHLMPHDFSIEAYQPPYRQYRPHHLNHINAMMSVLSYRRDARKPVLAPLIVGQGDIEWLGVSPLTIKLDSNLPMMADVDLSGLHFGPAISRLMISILLASCLENHQVIVTDGFGHSAGASKVAQYTLLSEMTQGSLAPSQAYCVSPLLARKVVDDLLTALLEKDYTYACGVVNSLPLGIIVRDDCPKFLLQTKKQGQLVYKRENGNLVPLPY
jgi:hypothetical protein